MLVVVHILAGMAGLASGAVALSALKGAKVHRKSGMFFVYAMTVMAATGATIAVLRDQVLSVIAGVVTLYLVLTALITVRRKTAGFSWIDLALTSVAVAAGSVALVYGIQAVQLGGMKDGFPAPAYFLYAIVALLAATLDVRVLLGRRLLGVARLARHLWRMCFALFIATASFFLGQADEFPEALQIPALLSAPVLVVLFLMFFWLVRVLRGRMYQRA